MMPSNQHRKEHQAILLHMEQEKLEQNHIHELTKPYHQDGIWDVARLEVELGNFVGVPADVERWHQIQDEEHPKRITRRLAEARTNEDAAKAKLDLLHEVKRQKEARVTIAMSGERNTGFEHTHSQMGYAGSAHVRANSPLIVTDRHGKELTRTHH